MRSIAGSSASRHKRDEPLAHTGSGRGVGARQIPVEQKLGLDQERLHVVARQPIVDDAALPAALRQLPAMQRDQKIDRGLVARLDRRRRIAADNPLVAEILHDDQPVIEIGVQ